MAPLTISEEQLQRVLVDVETLIKDVASLLESDEIAKKRLAEIRADPSIGKSEEELDTYLKKRGVEID